MSPLKDLPRYRCHKEVRALKIANRCVSFEGSAEVWTDTRLLNDSTAPQAAVTDWGLTFAEPGYPPAWLGASWFAKHNPQPGGYYVLYDDGYASYSPAKAFEEGYTLIP